MSWLPNEVVFFLDSHHGVGVTKVKIQRRRPTNHQSTYIALYIYILMIRKKSSFDHLEYLKLIPHVILSVVNWCRSSSINQKVLRKIDDILDSLGNLTCWPERFLENLPASSILQNVVPVLGSWKFSAESESLGSPRISAQVPFLGATKKLGCRLLLSNPGRSRQSEGAPQQQQQQHDWYRQDLASLGRIPVSWWTTLSGWAHMMSLYFTWCHSSVLTTIYTPPKRTNVPNKKRDRFNRIHRSSSHWFTGNSQSSYSGEYTSFYLSGLRFASESFAKICL